MSGTRLSLLFLSFTGSSKTQRSPENLADLRGMWTRAPGMGFLIRKKLGRSRIAGGIRGEIIVRQVRSAKSCRRLVCWHSHSSSLVNGKGSFRCHDFGAQSPTSRSTAEAIPKIGTLIQTATLGFYQSDMPQRNAIAAASSVEEIGCPRCSVAVDDASTFRMRVLCLCCMYDPRLVSLVKLESSVQTSGSIAPTYPYTSVLSMSYHV